MKKINLFGLIILCLCIVAFMMRGIIGYHKDLQKNEQYTIVQNKDKKDNFVNNDKEKENLNIEILGEGWTLDKVHLRKEADKESKSLTTLEKGTKVDILDEGEEWIKVSYQDTLGYIKAEYVTTKKEELEEAKTVTPQTGGHVICIDPGHQRSGDSTPEPNGPGSGTQKARVTGGTTGTTTGVTEYQLNLDISLKLKQELQARGYTVYMTRESHDVNISNKERAEYATQVGADITVRIHANGSENAGVSGALALTPSSGNPYVAHLSGASYSLSQCILDSYCAATGLNNQGVQTSDTMTGINWCTMPVTILEMGYMTNPSDDTNMQDGAFQQKMVQGIANGIDAYFGNH